MSMDNHPDHRRPGEPPFEPDPAYGGTKPAAADFWTMADMSGRPAPSDAMSARLAQNWWAIALRGAFAILFGIVAILMPGPTLAALVLLFAAYMIVDGVLAIVAGARAARRHDRWGWLVFEGIVDLAAAAIAILFPAATIFAFVLLVGAWAIVTGILLWGAALRLNLAHGRWLMALAGILSVIWGFLLIVWPAIGALVLAWWMGAYALFFGGALLALAFQLRRRRDNPPASQPLSQGA